jgi:hypothetical protein
VPLIDNSTPTPSESPLASETPGLDAWRALRLERWMADVAEANPHTVRHAGGCGERLLCDRPEHRSDGYPRVEILPSGTLGVAPGTLIFHCEGLTLPPNDVLYAARRDALRRREEAT